MDTNSKKSFWDAKPYWCQPWSIISFGVLVLIFSWKIFNIIISSILTFFVFSWWILFLILAPNSYKEINEKE